MVSATYDVKVWVCLRERECVCVVVRLLGRRSCILNETCPILIYMGLNIFYKSGLTIILMLWFIVGSQLLLSFKGLRFDAAGIRVFRKDVWITVYAIYMPIIICIPLSVPFATEFSTILVCIRGNELRILIYTYNKPKWN